MKQLSILFLCALLCACGFHLRGSLHLPQSVMPIAVVSNHGHSPLERIIESKLRLQSVDVTDNPSKAKYWIIILHQRMRKNIAAIAASTAPRQYQLTYQVVFQLQKVKGKTNLSDEPITISVDRLLTINNDRILGSDSEATILKREMRADVATQILARLENSLYSEK